MQTKKTNYFGALNLKIPVLTLLLIFVLIGYSQAQQKPNILVIWGDDIGTWNISHNNRGMMG